MERTVVLNKVGDRLVRRESELTSSVCLARIPRYKACQRHSLTSLAVWRNPLYMPTNPLLNLTVKQLRGAVRVRERMEDLQSQLDRILGVQDSRTADSFPKRRKRRRKMSAAARASLSAAAKARWKRVKARGGKS